MADQISDAIFKQDPRSRVAAETLTNTGDDDTEYGIDHKGCAVLVAYDKQSNDIAQGVD